MANTITLSISNEDKQFLEDNKHLSPTKVFRHALFLQKGLEHFINLAEISDYYRELREFERKFRLLGKEIERRQERIESLQDVLVEKEAAERRA